MSNLIDKYGTAWFSSKFGGSYFYLDGEPAKIDRVASSYVSANVALRRKGKVEIYTRQISHDYFPDSGVFSVPELGYRHLDHGKWLVYFSRDNRSYRRGVCARNIISTPSDHTRFLMTSGVRLPYPTDLETCNLLLSPTFIPLHEGIKLMLDGRIMSFAASPTLAVVPSSDDDSLIIHLCSKVIGKVSPDGELSLDVPFASKYIEGATCRAK